MNLWTSSPGVGSCGSPNIPNVLKHWAVVLEYMSVRTVGTVNKTILYDANEDRGFLIASATELGPDDLADWRENPGFVEHKHGLVTISEDRARAYCHEFNRKRVKYVATSDNCQKFVDQFIANLLAEEHIPLPFKVEAVKTCFVDSMSSSMKSGSVRLAKWALPKLASVLKEVAKNIKLEHFESIFGKELAVEAKEVILRCLNKGIKYIAKSLEGASSWWNLLQLPVELIVRELMRWDEFTELQVYAGGKLASCLTATGVGTVHGGPHGCVISVAFWLSAEVAATLIKVMLSKTFGTGFTSVFGESETVELIKSIYKYFDVKCKSGMDANLRWIGELKSEMECELKARRKVVENRIDCLFLDVLLPLSVFAWLARLAYPAMSVIVMLREAFVLFKNSSVPTPVFCIALLAVWFACKSERN